ncbi:class I SAM-dependent methyltransferase [Pseudalkalibacillus hwajinpoensis]|uniref:class I SAM-dependent methyltransferase n=1 Tax=Guptibacillus hwajinpoensis TaxID=208199 RepID=UPI00325A7A38
MRKSTEDTYNALTSTYEKSIDHASPYNAFYERPAMMDEVDQDLSGKKALDAGCSAGWYSEQLVGRGADVTGVDLSSEMIHAAKRRLGERASFMQHDLTQSLPFDENSFDLIISSLTLHYLEDWNPVLEEFDRVLKSGGKLLFSVHHPFMDFTRFETKDYFKTTLLTETWHKQEITIDVCFYRRALQDVINSVTNHFCMEELIEPQPVKEMKVNNQFAYNYLMTNPHFLLVKSRSQK